MAFSPTTMLGGGGLLKPKTSTNKTTTSSTKSKTPTAVVSPLSALGVKGTSYSKPTNTSSNTGDNGDNNVGNYSTPVTTTTSAASNSGTSSYSQSLFDYFKEKNEKARQSSLDAILAKLKMGESQYNANIDNITDQYQALRNQSEVERYKSQRAIREALANRGQLDSGFGRQEQLELDTQYGNAINSLNTQETKAKNEVQNLIAQLRAEAELEKANIENQYNAAIENFKSQMGA